MGLSPANYGLLRNARHYLNQRWSARGGMTAISNVAFDQLIVHSIKRLNDASAVVGNVVQVAGHPPGIMFTQQGASTRIYGAGTKLYLGEGTTAIDSGYSGNPLGLMIYRPDQSASPWVYVADSLRMRKVRIDGTIHSIGIEPPLTAPTVTFGADVFKAIGNFAVVGSWVNGVTAGALSEVARLNTTISQILYDAGSTGFSSIVPASMAGIGQGELIVVNTGGGSQETMLVSQVRQAIAATTIGSIFYDTGTTGLCTIQPGAGTSNASDGGIRPIITKARTNFPSIIFDPRFSVSDPRLTAALPIRPIISPGGPGTIPKPPQPRPPSTMPVGIQPNTVVLLNSGGGNQEYVRVISISPGPNNSVSFRCSTVNTHVAGETITGVGSFRGYLVNNHVATETLKDGSIASAIGSGIGTISLTSPFDLTTAGGNAIQESDTIHLSVLMDHPEFMTEVKIMFDVDGATNNFTQNYFYATMRQNDTQQAAVSNQTALSTRQQAITKILTSSFSQGRSIGISPPDQSDGAIQASFQKGGTVGTSFQASTGGSQWTEFVCKVSDLVRVGADTSRSLANVAATRIQFQVSAVVNVQVGDLWIGGTFGPDVGTTGSPFFYRVRGRSTLTGVRSLAGPPTRYGVEPHSQKLIIQPKQHPNPSVNVLDVFRWGGTLTAWYYVGFCQNTANPQFTDTLNDTDIANNPTLEVDQFQPFPTVDLPHSGICTTFGTKIVYVSGDKFNVQWYPGSQININGIFYTLYAQPPGDGTLEIVENAGTQVGVPFFLNQATLLAQNHYAFWGPYAEGTAAFCFSCADTFQPGYLFITNGNNPDAASDTLQTEITSPSEPLINGCMYDNLPFVWSCNRLFKLAPNLGSVVVTPTVLDPNVTQLFIPQDIPGSKGLFAPWAFCVGPMIWYLSEDGIEESNGASSESITDEQLYILFPHDGQPAQPVTVGTITVNPPDMTQTAALRLAFDDDFLYFDFIDTTGVRRTLVYNIRTKEWAVDDYTPKVVTHYSDEGTSIHAMILGGVDGRAYLNGGITDGNGQPFPCEMRMPQLSELQGGYEVPIDGFLGLQASQAGNISLVVNVDGADNLITVPVTTTYQRLYQRLLPLKGKLLAFGLASLFPFSLFQRDTEFKCGNWGRDGAAGPINPFSDLRRAQAPKVG